MSVGQRIRAKREELGLDLFGLSQRAGIREQTLRTWEDGRRSPSDLEMLARVADALETSLDWLATGVEPAAV